MSFAIDINIQQGVNYPHLGIGVAAASYPLTAKFTVVAVEKTAANTADARYQTEINGRVTATNRFEFSYEDDADLFVAAESKLKCIFNKS
ncbi:hypothetical protein [Klebsiella quasipneumoniae]|uniref:hypothetical protein n=1 Tax=Klebsiella quasipneumoniae TaxID=1463165 RepID=UPI000C7A0078|nr:hypothetical protein [Klebsiella quasipneumoniae]PLC73559.1 hypothetical protein B6I39_04465 [Klebsiella quasipneumoniae]